METHKLFHNSLRGSLCYLPHRLFQLSPGVESDPEPLSIPTIRTPIKNEKNNWSTAVSPILHLHTPPPCLAISLRRYLATEFLRAQLLQRQYLVPVVRGHQPPHRGHDVSSDAEWDARHWSDGRNVHQPAGRAMYPYVFTWISHFSLPISIAFHCLCRPILPRPTSLHFLTHAVTPSPSIPHTGLLAQRHRRPPHQRRHVLLH